VEDRISELEDKTVIKEKTKEMLVKQFKSSERNMQELNDFIKRPWESWILKEKRSKQKGFTIYSTK
jgi:hypothetical protein